MTTIDALVCGYSGIQAIDLPTSLTAIGEYAFEGSMLQNIGLPDGQQYRCIITDSNGSQIISGVAALNMGN